MTWTSKYWLLGLWLLPAVAWLLRHAAAGTRRSAARFAEPEMARRLAPRRSGVRETVRGVLILAGLAAALTAAAGPRDAGEVVRVEKKGADILVLLDISRSMLSDDVKPNRLESAKLDINDLLERVRGDRVGLIAFAGRPMVKIPLTSDSAFFRESLKSLSAGDAPRGGTAIGDAIRLALRSAEADSTRDRAIILITDGEDHESDPLEAADQAAAMGVRIFTVALGDAETGGRIPLYDNQGKLTGYQKYKGQEIRTKADRGLLAEIAEKTGGAFLDMGQTPTDLGTFYQKSMNLKRSGYGETDRRVWKEKYQPFLLAGILLIWAGMSVSPFRPGRAAAAALILAAVALPMHAGTLFAAPPNEDEIDFFDRRPDEMAGEVSAEPESAAETPAGGEEQSTAAEEPDGGEPAAEMTAEELYNEACRRMDSGDETRAAECLRQGLEIVEPRQKSLRGKLRFNLGVLEAKGLKAESEKLFAGETGGNGTPAGVPETGEPKDTVAEYRKGAAERNTALVGLLANAERAAATLRAAADDGNREMGQAALRNSDLVLSWAQEQADRFDKSEREKREALFAPTDQMRWLDEELTKIGESKAVSARPETGAAWQELHELGKELGQRKTDLESLLEQGKFADSENAEASAERLDHAESALAALRTAAETLPIGGESAADELRRAAAELDRAALTYSDYRTVVLDALARQEEIVKRCGAGPVRPENGGKSGEGETAFATRASLSARAEAVGRRLERMTADARREFAERPYAEEEAKGPDPESGVGGTGDGDGGRTDGTDFFESPDEEGGTVRPERPAEEAAEGKREELSPEERVRRSMNLALELGPEMTRLQEEMAGLPDEAFSAEAPAKEARILELLRRVAEPLQEENRNQGGQNQDRQNRSEQNQQDQNRQDQNGEDQDPQDQDGQNQDGEDQKRQGQQNRRNEDPQEQEERNPEEKQEPRQSGEEKEAQPMTPEEEEVKRQEERTEAMMRKVRERQRQVEQIRRQRERLFQRYEKPEKDW